MKLSTAKQSAEIPAKTKQKMAAETATEIATETTQKTTANAVTSKTNGQSGLETPETPEALVALSKPEAYSFLKDVKQADERLESERLLKTPLETAASQTESFTDYTTGTVSMKITPELMGCLEGLRQLNTGTDLKKLAHFVQALQHDFPAREGVLVQMINPVQLATQVPFCGVPEDVTESMLEQSRWSIELQGDYALIHGAPVWDRLEGERVDFYNLFKLYRDARYGMLDSGDYILCSRSMAGLARTLQLPALLVSTIAKIYNWQLRCTYYDIFFEKEVMRRKQVEVQLLQRDQLKFATTLVDKAMTYFEKNTNQLTPKDALSMLELGFRFSRLSLDMQPDKPGIGPSNAPAVALQINQTQENKVVQYSHTTNQNFSSEVERQLHESMKEQDTLVNILSVLQRSGAIDVALRDSALETPVIDVEAQVVEDESVELPIHVVEPSKEPPAAFGGE